MGTPDFENNNDYATVGLVVAHQQIRRPALLYLSGLQRAVALDHWQLNLHGDALGCWPVVTYLLFHRVLQSDSGPMVKQ